MRLKCLGPHLRKSLELWNQKKNVELGNFLPWALSGNMLLCDLQTWLIRLFFLLFYKPHHTLPHPHLRLHHFRYPPYRLPVHLQPVSGGRPLLHRHQLRGYTWGGTSPTVKRPTVTAAVTFIRIKNYIVCTKLWWWWLLPPPFRVKEVSPDSPSLIIIIKTFSQLKQIYVAVLWKPRVFVRRTTPLPIKVMMCFCAALCFLVARPFLVNAISQKHLDGNWALTFTWTKDELIRGQRSRSLWPHIAFLILIWDLRNA